MIVAVGTLCSCGEKKREPTPMFANGAVLHLSSEAGTPDAVLARVPCHRAWLMMESGARSDSPLLVDGVAFVAHESGIGVELMISVDNPVNLPELLRRTRLNVDRVLARRQQARSR